MPSIRHGGFFDIAQWIVRINRRMDDLDRIEIPDISGAFSGARYSTNAGQSITSGSYQIVDFEDQDYDTNNAVTTGASWKFTAPTAGYYLVTASILYSSTTTWAETEQAIMALYKGGSIDCELDRRTGLDSSGGAAYVQLGGATVIYLAASNYIDIRTYQNSGGALALYNVTAHNVVTISKLG